MSAIAGSYSNDCRSFPQRGKQAILINLNDRIVACGVNQLFINRIFRNYRCLNFCRRLDFKRNFVLCDLDAFDLDNLCLISFDSRRQRADRLLDFSAGKFALN